MAPFIVVVVGHEGKWMGEDPGGEGEGLKVRRVGQLRRWHRIATYPVTCYTGVVIAR